MITLKGNLKKVSDYFAEKHSIDPKLLSVFAFIESTGDGFFMDWNGALRIKIQFEPHIFAKYARIKGIKARSLRVGKYQILYVNGLLMFKNGIEPQAEEYKAFNSAWEIDKEVAMLATSWGLGQIMGFNYKLAGYSSVGDMVTSFRKSEVAQLSGMLKFMENTGIVKHLQNGDIDKALRIYNGPKYKEYGYKKKFTKYYYGI